MHPFFERRVAYGRRVRDRAACLIDAHGAHAQAEALAAAVEPGLTESERSFWEAIALRIGRFGRHAGTTALA